MNESKTCSDCREIKPLDGFYAKPDAADRHSPYCKECQKRRSTEARERRERYYREFSESYEPWVATLCASCGTRPCDLPISEVCFFCRAEALALEETLGE